MSYELSFSPEFFALPGEVYDGADYPHGDRPYSVIGALRAMPEEQWTEMVRDVFECDPDYVDAETVLQKIQETDTCGTISVPVDVWIDAEGFYRVDVYERGERPEM